MIGEGDGIHRPNFEAKPLQREDGGGIPDMPKATADCTDRMFIVLAVVIQIPQGGMHTLRL